jgi:hypothetical protein
MNPPPVFSIPGIGRWTGLTDVNVLHRQEVQEADDVVPALEYPAERCLLGESGAVIRIPTGRFGVHFFRVPLNDDQAAPRLEAGFQVPV